MENPLITAKEAAELSQRKIATLLGVSQQFVQRLESGQAETIPDYVSDFYKTMLTRDQQITLFADRSLAEAYELYVTTERMLLPDLRKEFTRCEDMGRSVEFFLTQLISKLRIKTPNSVFLSLASKLHVSTAPVYRYFAPDNLSARCDWDEVPSELRRAFTGTGGARRKDVR